MDSKLLKSIVIVIDEGSIAAAALREGITASAISQRIKALEGMLGEKLLIRSGRNVQPTSACMALMPQILRVLEEVQVLREINPLNAASGDIRIGAISTVLSDEMPLIIRQITSRFPQVSLSIHPGTSKALFQQFQDGELDLVIGVRPPFSLPKSLQFIALETQPVGLLSALTTDVGCAPLIVYQRQSWGGAECWQAAQRINQSGPVLCELDALETIAIMVQNGVGVSIVPYWRGLDQRFNGLAFQPIDKAGRTIGLLIRNHQIQHPVVKMIETCFGQSQ